MKRARSSFAAIPESCGPPKVDILPSTRKRISSGGGGTGRFAMAFLAFGFLARDFAFGGFCRERCGADLPDFGLRFRAGIRLYLLTAKPCLWYIQAGPERRGRVRAIRDALAQWCRRLENMRRGCLARPT